MGHHFRSDLEEQQCLPSVTDYPSRFYCMEDLATHFASLPFLKNQRSLTPKHPLASQSLKMAVRDRLSSGYFGFNGGHGVNTPTQTISRSVPNFLTRAEPIYEFRVNPQQLVDRYLEETKQPRVSQKQKNHIHNRVYPFQRNGFGSGGRRESGGTGVFHPRVVNPSLGNGDVKRKQSVGSREHCEMPVTEQRSSSVRRVLVKKQEECYYHLPPEMGLPRDWTY